MIRSARRRSPGVITPILTASSVPIPSAVSVLQRIPEPELPYQLRTRLVDSWHGFRDRRRVANHVRGDGAKHVDRRDADFATDFLIRLTAECNTRQETERRTTRVALAVLDDTIVTARQKVRSLTEHLPHIDQRIKDAAQVEPGDGPVTSAERYDTPEQRRARRERAHRAQVAALQAERRNVVDGIDDARRTIGTACEARRAHWDQLLVRTEVLRAHYNRRSRTYARSATRRSRVLISTSRSLIVEPDWSKPEAIPTEPAA